MIRGIPAEAWRLMAARLARSVAQGALVVDFALYARHLGWGAGFLGLVFGGSMLFAVALTATIGPLSDRLGRRQFLIAYEFLSILAAGIALLSQATAPVALAAIIGGFGRGANGAAGPFSPAEQSWLSRFIEKRRLGHALSVNISLGFFGMGAGAVIAGIMGARQAMFVLPLAAACIALLLVLLTPDPAETADTRAESRTRPQPEDAGADPEPDPAQQESTTRRGEHGLLWRLAGINALNGTAIGLIAPFMSWWFAAKYGVTAAAVGPALAIAFVASGVASLAASRLTLRFGAVRTVVWMRSLGLILLFVLPFAPSFALATALYAVRSACNRGSAGPRQAVALGLVRGHRRGLAASVNALSIQVPRGIAPALAGALFAQGALATPFLVAGLFQAGYLVLYPRAFGAHDPSRTTGEAEPWRKDTQGEGSERVSPRS